jgi:uncharacterized protein (TIGR01777 family)
MKIMLAGASGMVGQALMKLLHDQDLIVIGRNKKNLQKLFPKVTCLTWQALPSYKTPVDVVIHLSGENIGNHRWNQPYQKKIVDSRVNTAKALIDWVNQFEQPIHILAANAIGYYGIFQGHHSPIFTEDAIIDTKKPQCFLQEVAFAWEKIWEKLSATHRLTVMRFGVVLQKHQGMLKKLEPSFYLGMGAVVGNGEQYISWVHIDDLCQAILWLVKNQLSAGTYNIVAPGPVPQMFFANTLAKILHRPQFLKLPAFLVQILFGQMGEELLLQGQYVMPKKLTDHGFNFEFPSLEKALTNLYQT